MQTQSTGSKDQWNLKPKRAMFRSGTECAMKKKPHRPRKPRKPKMDSFNEYREKLRQIMRAGGGSLLARHKHAQQSIEERISDTEPARKRAKEVVWETKFPTPKARSREMSRRRLLGLERERTKEPPKRPKR